MASITPALIVHGGAGDIPADRVPLKNAGAKKAVREGMAVLLESGNVLDAVEAAIRSMDLDPVFNCGYGSVLTSKGEVEQDALIIKGSSLEAGAVGEIKHLLHPITLARKVMETTPHTFIVGPGAEEVALKEGMNLVSNESLIAPQAKIALERYLRGQKGPTNELGQEHGTVGAVAINANGEIAAATATGGITGKLPGRIGDTPVIGGGTYADDNVYGASATGLGEAIMKANVTSRVAHLISTGMDPKKAMDQVLALMTTKFQGADAGIICITKEGRCSYSFNSERMSWAYAQGDQLHYGIEHGEDIVEPL